MNWRGRRPLTSIRTMVELIPATTTNTGRTVTATYDPNWYATGIKITGRQFDTVHLHCHDWHGDWNYTLNPT